MDRSLAAGVATLLMASAPWMCAPCHSAPGQLDPTFGDGGIVGFDYGTALRALDPLPHVVALRGGLIVEGDGGILVSGYHLPSSTPSSRPYAAVVARRLPDGTVDAGFGSRLGLSWVTGGQAEGMVRQSDGRVVFEITFVGLGYNYHLGRMSSDGVLDPTFPPSYPVFGFLGARRVAAAGGDRLLVAGFRNEASIGEVWQVHRRERDGQADASFGLGGIATGTFPGIAFAAVEDAAGLVVAAGSVSGTPTRALVRRYLANGAVDASFGIGGAVTLAVPDAAAFTSLAIQPDGRIVAAGWIGSAPARSLMARFLSDGSPDPSFGSGGVSAGDFPIAIRDLALHTSGSLVVAGTDESTSPRRSLVARYRPDGRPDVGFGSAGATVLASCGTQACTRAVKVAPDGKIVVLTEGRASATSDEGLLFRLLGDEAIGVAPIPVFSPIAVLTVSAALALAGVLAARRR